MEVGPHDGDTEYTEVALWLAKRVPVPFVPQRFDTIGQAFSMISMEAMR